MQGSSRDTADRPVGRTVVNVSLLTPVGRGALAVVGVAGPGAEPLVARLFAPRGSRPLADRPAGSIAFGRWTGGGLSPGETTAGSGEELVVVRRGPDDLEVHCHGGLAASEAVITSLERHGAVRQLWPEWLRSGGMAEIEVEAHEAISRAGGPKAARILMRQLAGALGAEFDRVQRLVASGDGAAALAAIDRLTRAARVGLRLARPWRVVLAGGVNAGKSSLANALAGHARSIVSAEPGTTRDLLETRIVLDGWEVELVDTAGLRDEIADAAGLGTTEREGISRAVAAVADADLVLRVVDGSHGTSGTAVPRADREMVVYSKADLFRPQNSASDIDAVWTSGVTGAGIETLAIRIVRRLVPEADDESGLLAGAVPFTERQLREIDALRQAAYSSLPFDSVVRPRT